MYITNSNILWKYFLIISINYISFSSTINAAPIFYEIRDKQLIEKSNNKYILIKDNQNIVKYIKEDNSEPINNKPNFKTFKDKINLRQIYKRYNIRLLCRDLKRDNYRIKKENKIKYIIIEGTIIDCSNPRLLSTKNTKIINNISIENTNIDGINTNFGVNIK